MWEAKALRYTRRKNVFKGKIKSPEECFEIIKEWFKERNIKLPFFTALIFGFIIHFELFSQHITNPDGIWNGTYHMSGRWEVSLGRWLLPIIDIIRGGIASPWVNTVISIFYIALTSVIIVKLFDMKSKVAMCLSSIAIVAMPTLSEILFHWYCSDAYSLSILFAVCSVYFVLKRERNFKNLLIGALFITGSMAIYQAQLGFIVTLCVMIPITQILRGEKSIKELLIDLGRCVIMGILGGLIYILTETIALNIYETTLATYKGANSIDMMNIISNFLVTIQGTYNKFSLYYFGDLILNNSYWLRIIFNAIIFTIVGISIVLIILKNKIYKDIPKLLLLVILISVIPICLGIVEIIVVGTEINLLMSSSYILPIIFAIALLDQNKIFQVILNWAIYIIVTCIITTYIFSTNASYIACETTYNQIYSYAIRALDRIESSEEYNRGMKVMFAGNINRTNYLPNFKSFQITNGHFAVSNLIGSSYSSSRGGWDRFLCNHLGTKLNWCTDEEYKQITEVEEFKEMQIFPYENSVKVINGIMVVKFSYDPPMPQV